MTLPYRWKERFCPVHWVKIRLSLNTKNVNLHSWHLVFLDSWSYIFHPNFRYGNSLNLFLIKTTRWPYRIVGKHYSDQLIEWKWNWDCIPGMPISLYDILCSSILGLIFFTLIAGTVSHWIFFCLELQDDLTVPMERTILISPFSENSSKSEYQKWPFEFMTSSVPRS